MNFRASCVQRDWTDLGLIWWEKGWENSNGQNVSLGVSVLVTLFSARTAISTSAVPGTVLDELQEGQLLHPDGERVKRTKARSSRVFRPDWVNV